MPPFVGVAVKVTLVPAQMLFCEAPIDTLTVRSGFTIILMVLEVAGLPLAQVALEVKTQVTASLFTGT